GDGGIATAAQLSSPGGLARDSAGNLYIADTDNHRIRKVTPDGLITTVAGSGRLGSEGVGGPAVAAELNRPRGQAVDAFGNLYLADTGNHRVLKVTPTGTINLLAGAGVAGLSGDGGAATAAQLNSPQSVAVDAAGNVYIADTGNHRVRKITPTGMIM